MNFLKPDQLNRFSLLLYFFFFFISPVRLISSESYTGNGFIKGRVLDQESTPVRGATIILFELNTGTTTDTDGYFEFRGLRDGYYNLNVKSMGFASANLSVWLKDGNVFIPVGLQQTHIELREVIVQESITGMVQPEQSLSVTTANGEFLNESSALTLMQVLQRIPGISSMDIGSTVSKPVIRGLGFNRLVVAENNIKQQGQQWGADHGLEIDMFGVERVEIVKGPASLIFGSDAIGGLINIRPPVIPQENNTELEIQTAARSNNDLFGGSAMAAINRNGRFLRFRISYQDYADYRVPANRFVYNTWVIPIPNRRLKNTSGNDLALSFVSGIRKSWGISTLTFSNFNQKTGFFPASHGIPNPGSLSDPGNPREIDFPRQQVNHFKVVSNTNFFMGTNRMEVDLGFQQNHRQELNPPHVHGKGPIPDGSIELDLVLNTITTNVRLHKKRSDFHSLIFGFSGSLQDNSRGGYNFLLPDFSTSELGFYAISKWTINDKLFINTGLRGDGAFLKTTRYNEPIWQDKETISYYRERSPELERRYYHMTISSGISWIPINELNIKANLGNSFRNPTAIELAANGIHHGSFRHEMGDSTLKPEKAWQFDLGLTWSLKEFYFHMSPFVNYFSNYLFLNPSGNFSDLPGAGQIYRFQQAEAIHFGGELYADWHITHALHSSIGVEAVWAHNLDNNYPLPFIPPPSLLAELSYNWQEKVLGTHDLKLILSARNVTAQNRVARNEPATAAYTLINTGMTLSIPWGNFALDISFMINNVFNIRYMNHLSFYRKLELPEPGRNFIISVKSNLQW